MPSTDWIAKLKVAELKEELKKRGLAIAGKKAELAERLEQHVINNEAEEDKAEEPEAAPEEPQKEAPMEEDAAPAEEQPAEQAQPAAAPADVELEQPAEPEDAAPPPSTASKTKRGKGKNAKKTTPVSEPKQQQQKQTQQRGKEASKASVVAARPALTLSEIHKDNLMQLADERWSAATLANASAPAFDPTLVEKIYEEELGGALNGRPPAQRRVALLELSQYLENYLWKHFNAATASPAHIFSILLMVNEKFKENIAAWDCFSTRPEEFSAFFSRVLALKDERPLQNHERATYLTFMLNAFRSLENEMVRSQVLRLVSLPLWHSLSQGRLQLELHEHPQLTRHWKHAAKKEAKAAQQEGYVPVQQRPEGSFIPSLITEFFTTLQAAVSPDGQPNSIAIAYCERFVDFVNELLSQLPTRRFLHAVLDDKALLVKCQMSALHTNPAGQLFKKLVATLQFYLAFPIDDHSGDALSEDAVTAHHYERIQQLQRLFFKHWEKLKDLALTNCGTVQQREVLTTELSKLTQDELKALITRQLRLVNEDDPLSDDPQFLTEVMISAYEKRQSQRRLITEMPLYPTESLLLDENQVPVSEFKGDAVLSLPKLNLQFLTLQDYLLRNFYLYRLEAAYEIREDISDVLRRMSPYLGEDDATHFGGWARMATTIEKFAVIEVRKPKVGETRPGAVTADIVVETKHMRQEVKKEWDELKQHDVIFLLSVRPHDDINATQARFQKGEITALEAQGLRHVRGCEVLEVRDEAGVLMNDFTGRIHPDEWKPPKGTLRTVTVALDTSQYQMDVEEMAAAKQSSRRVTDVYTSFNLLMRRKAKENNFKAVLECIRDLIGEDTTIPEWLHDILLGYGDPGAAQFQNMEGTLQTVDFKDTFLDAQHVEEAFPDYEVEFVGDKEPQRPFRLTFPSFKPAEEPAPKSKRKATEDPEPAPVAPPAEKPKLLVESYIAGYPGPYPQDLPPQNTVRFTPVQTQAILSGIQPGLTMVVGPPGTGKTDTAVQIMHILYHNCPNQRTLIITHSNQALNDLFSKILERDVPARYLLRLGMGEAELDTDEQFSRVGRVNAMLARRLELLAEVERLAKSLKVPESVAYTCETAGHFWLLHVLSRWEKFISAAGALKTAECVAELFPFTEFFSDAPQPLFLKQSFNEDMERAKGCFKHLKITFKELEEVRPFEILKTQGDRINYLLMKQAKIVAMTCTHAALKRREFLELGFKYDNLLMEESAQVLEVETTIPMLLQKPEDGHNRLKRVILIGDHHQLPPVVKNSALQKYSHLDQSLFTRFIRLGTPYIELNAQGRARPSLAKLYNWRYRALGDLPNVSTRPEFTTANAGFAFDYQLIDVPDYHGKGESEPVQYFYQNLGEAEYVVSVYQYMRLLGYPAERISILTTYNGQKALLQDVVQRRCAGHALFGRPASISTVDQYQGNQNDFILLSLVRTKHFGHLRDVRRLVVATSRSRLGLYIFARGSLFANCFELQPTFNQLLARPTSLALVPGEQYSTVERKVEDVPAEAVVVQGVEHMATIVEQMAAEWSAAVDGAVAMNVEGETAAADGPANGEEDAMQE